MILVIAVAAVIAGAAFAMKLIKDEDRKKGLRVDDEEYTIGSTLSRMFTGKSGKHKEKEGEIKYIRAACIAIGISGAVAAVIDIITGINPAASILMTILLMLILIYAGKNRKSVYVLLSSIMMMIIFYEFIRQGAYGVIPIMTAVVFYDCIYIRGILKKSKK
jgi:hypothetical protein